MNGSPGWTAEHRGRSGGWLKVRALQPLLSRKGNFGCSPHLPASQRTLARLRLARLWLEISGRGSPPLAPWGAVR